MSNLEIALLSLAAVMVVAIAYLLLIHEIANIEAPPDERMRRPR